MNSNDLDPNEKVTFAVVVRTLLKHVKSLKEFMSTYPDTYLAYNRTSLGYLRIEPTDKRPILPLEDETNG